MSPWILVEFITLSQYRNSPVCSFLSFKLGFEKLSIYLFIYFFFFYIFVFLGLHPQHTEVLRLGVKVELKLQAYATAEAMRDLSHVCDLHYSSQ